MPKILCKRTCFANGSFYIAGKIYDIPKALNEHFEGFKQTEIQTTNEKPSEEKKEGSK